MIALAMIVAMQTASPAAPPEEIMSDCYVSDMSTDPCLDQRFQKADRELKAVFDKVLVKVRKLEQKWKKGGVSYVDALEESQRAWAEYRDAECRMEAFPLIDGNGVIPSAAVLGCRMKLTLARLAMMRESLKEN